MARGGSAIASESAIGRLGNVIVQRDRHGRPYFRTARVGQKSPSLRQETIRSNWATFPQRWLRTLSNAQRDGWNTYANNPNLYLQGLTGQQLYCRNNFLRSLATTDEQGYNLSPQIIDTAPNWITPPTLDTPQFEVYDGDPHGYLHWFANDYLEAHNTAHAILAWLTPLNWTGRLKITPTKAYPFPFNKNAYQFADTMVSHDVPPYQTQPYAFRLPYTPSEGDLVNAAFYYADAAGDVTPIKYVSTRVLPPE